MTPLCFLDTETTGLHPGRRAWDVAMIRRDDTGQRVRQFYLEVDLADADPFALTIGRFYQRHPLGVGLSHANASNPSPSDGGYVGSYLTTRRAALEVARATHGAHLVASVPNFDADTLAGLLRREGFTPAWHYHLIDVENLAVGFLAANGTPVTPPWKSDELSAAIGVAPPTAEARHTALGDAEWAMRIYDHIVPREG